MKQYQSLAYASAEEMMFGQSPCPVTCGFDVKIGGGEVYPEVNYTLPSMSVERSNAAQVLEQYHAMVTGILSRMVELHVPGVVLEFEQTPQMTELIEIGAQITAQTKQLMTDFHEKHGLKSALRVTICDIREHGRPPQIRNSEVVPRFFKSFEENARLGADMLSIESIGGKEVSDRAILEGDVPGLLFALGILVPRDMHFLWNNITAIANAHHVVSAGDTACGFANTAMVLADRRMVPNVVAAVVRAMTAVRSLVAYEEGAVGPSKDCGYEGPVMKAITGYPIAMEGKSAACAHFSHVGNIAAAVCDLWSNESVQNVKLLSGFAPEVFAEILEYDCRLMNQALRTGEQRTLQRLFVDSDEYRSVHALIISPASSYRLAQAIVAEPDDYRRTHRAGVVACQILREAIAQNKLALSKRELTWLGRIEQQLDAYQTEAQALEYGRTTYKDLFLPQEYEL